MPVKFFRRCSPSTRLSISLLGACAALAACAPAGSAAVYTLSEGNSSLNINPATQAGLYNWMVDGQNLLNQQWYWFSIGAGTKSSIDTISSPVVNQASSSILTASYANSQLSIQLLYSLLGGASGSGVSDLSQQVKIQNLTASPLSFHFYQYVDVLGEDTVQFGTNLKGLVNEALVSNGGMTIDTTITPGANSSESAGTSLLNQLTGSPGPNTQWLVGWDTTLAAGGTMIISQDANVAGVTPVPEPAALSLAVMGLLAAGALKLRRGGREPEKNPAN